MVRTVFGCGEREEAAAALCPPDYLARRYPVWRMGAGRGLATLLLASPLATLAPIQLGRTRILDRSFPGFQAEILSSTKS